MSVTTIMTDLYKRCEKQGRDCLFDTACQRRRDKWATGTTDWGDGADGGAVRCALAAVDDGVVVAAAGGIRRK